VFEIATQRKGIMKKILVCVGLAAAGTTALQAAYAPDLNPMQTTKLWSMSGTLRGFYDDNYNTAPSGPDKRSSYGFEISPSFSLNVPLQQTELGLRYTYGLYYYQDRMQTSGRPIDQTHQADLWIAHAFSENWKTKVQDSFVVGQEPELLNAGIPIRVEGNNIHNDGTITLDTQWTRLLGSEVGYENNFYDYQSSGGTAAVPSLAGILNRLEHLAWVNMNWRVLPTATAFVGYQYGQINYIGNEFIAPGYVSANRDNRSHYGYAGLQYSPLENLSLAAKAGIQYIDFYNPPTGIPKTSQTSPYADLSATYTYLPGSYAQLGFRQMRNATDVVAPDATGKITEDQESSVVYASINHKFTPQLTGNVLGNVQYSTFKGGYYDSKSQTWYTLGLNLSYSFNPHVSAEVGYNYDYLTSDVPGQEYQRNRVYVGVTGTY
jgi:Putative beta-barrel porin 2